MVSAHADPALLARLDQAAAALSDPEVVAATAEVDEALASYYVAMVAAGVRHAEAIGAMAARAALVAVMVSGGDLE